MLLKIDPRFLLVVLLTYLLMIPASHQTPISFLQEVCAKWTIQPAYEFYTSRGPTKVLIFTFVCIAGQWKGTASGTNKKRAKHQSAMNILLQLLALGKLAEHEVRVIHLLQEGNDGSAGLPGGSGAEAGSNATGTDMDTVNVVGQLQEMCQKKLWPQPNYEFIQKPSVVAQGQSDFECVVALWKWKESATARSKKMAKRMAAEQMLNLIQRNNLTIPEEALAMMEESNLSMIENPGQNQNAATTTEPVDDGPKYMELIAKYTHRAMNGIWNKKGKKLPPIAIDWTVAENDPETLLEELGQLHSIPPVYSYITRTKSGQVHCHVQLSTQPVVVLLGRGSTLEDARRQAAFKALVHLNVMCQHKRVVYPQHLTASRGTFSTVTEPTPADDTAVTLVPDTVAAGDCEE